MQLESTRNRKSKPGFCSPDNPPIFNPANPGLCIALKQGLTGFMRHLEPENNDIRDMESTDLLSPHDITLTTKAHLGLLQNATSDKAPCD